MPILRVVWAWLQAAGAIVAVVALGWLGAEHAFHLKLLDVQTGSMRPAFQPGDALVMRTASLYDLRVGMVVSYRSPRNPNELVTHRVVRVQPNQRSFQTKGDQLAAPDPVVRSSLLVGRVVAIAPGMGKLLGWLHSWIGLAVCIYLPALAIGASELYALEQNYFRSRLYRLHEKQVV